MKKIRVANKLTVQILILVLVFAGTGLATTIPLTTADLVAASTNVVRGEVTSQNSQWNDSRNFIFTIVTIRVSEQLMGSLDASNEISIWLPGGEVDNTGLGVENVAKFEVGQDVILFLNPKDELFDVTGWEQGKYTLEAGEIVEKGTTIKQFTDEIQTAQR